MTDFWRVLIVSEMGVLFGSLYAYYASRRGITVEKGILSYISWTFVGVGVGVLLTQTLL